MKNYLFTLFLFTSVSLLAQNTYVPDDNFEQALIDLGYDTAPLDDSVLTANIDTVTTLRVRNKSISSLDGIEGFTALELLNCNQNQLTNIDLTANTSLINLYCSENQLTSINIAANTALKILFCYENQLSSIDISNNIALIHLFCSENQLTTLNVSKNIALEYLHCEDNQITSMNVSGDTALYILNCNNNLLTSLDISTNTALGDLDCGNNQLSNLNVSKNTLLTSLSCYSNQLTNLDVSKNTLLTSLHCYSNQLTNLDVSKNSVLAYLFCNNNQLNNLNVATNVAIDYLDCSINPITSLDVSKNTLLTSLRCFSNQLTNLDVSKNSALAYLLCNNNQLSDLNVTTNTKLTQLWCLENQLTNIDLRNGNNINLSDVEAQGNPNLTCIYVDDKDADHLIDWSKDLTASYINNEAECDLFDQETYVPDDNFEQALIDLGYDTAPLDNIVLTASIDTVTNLDISNKSISSLLGIEDFIALTRLNCGSNELTSLDVSANTNLVSLSCNNNELTILDVSANINLASLSCNNNELTNLDVRNANNANISVFEAQGNPYLTCIYVDDNSATYLSGWIKDATANFGNTEAECNGLAVNESVDNSIFTVYPNPVNNQFSIQTDKQIETIKLYNASGKLVKTYEEQNNYSVDNLQGGMYFISVYVNGEYSMQKLIIE